ncbi:MAG: Outer membrane protein TolC [Candidatus Ordinivivax streblomastigis]|uniref:Outer membrane protein TolC n=1 Tax=Candidatus Ordinivivax streblomastigis TaxID=2540710 RepID=A0A5M8P598_9BACT|nr:MAG: Outer membrane protein TolC [Candidatus Ordinivivax streblomastigis]
MKRMKSITSLAFAGWLVCLFQVQAQPKQWSLEECIQHAVEHNITIQQLLIQKESAEVDLNTSQRSRLPDLNAGMGQEWSFGYTPSRSGLYETQKQSNTNLSVASSMPLFTGFRIPNEIAKNQLELKASVENLEKAKEDLALNVASLFLQVLFNKELLKINEEQLALSKIQIERTRILVDEGKVPLSQLYDIEAQVANDHVSVIQADNNLKLALLDLSQSLELQQNADFDIRTPEVGNVIEEYMSSVQPPHIIFDNAIHVKPVIKEQEYRVESAEKTLKIAEAGYLPSLNLNLGYNTGYFHSYDLKTSIDPTTQLPIKATNVPFSEQFKNNGREYIGLSLNIPIFNRFSVRNQVQNARLNINNQQLALDNTKKTLYKEIETAYLNATAAQEKYRASTVAVKATSESFKYAQDRYETGKSSVFEFNEAKTKLVKSQSEQIQAKYDYIFRTKILDFYNGIPIKL